VPRHSALKQPDCCRKTVACGLFDDTHLRGGCRLSAARSLAPITAAAPTLCEHSRLNALSMARPDVNGIENHLLPVVPLKALPATVQQRGVGVSPAARISGTFQPRSAFGMIRLRTVICRRPGGNRLLTGNLDSPGLATASPPQPAGQTASRRVHPQLLGEAE